MENNNDEIIIQPLDENNDLDWLEYENLGKKCFKEEFEMLSQKAKKVGWKNLKENNNLNKIYFIKIKNKIIGCFSLEDISNLELKQIENDKSLLLKYLMILPKYRNKKIGEKILNIILMFALKNNFDYLKLSNKIDLKTIKKIEKLKFNQNEKDFFMVTNIKTNKQQTNISKKIFNAFAKSNNLKNISTISEYVIASDIEKKYCDLVRPTKELTLVDMMQIKKTPGLQSKIKNVVNSFGVVSGKMENFVRLNFFNPIYGQFATTFKPTLKNVKKTYDYVNDKIEKINLSVVVKKPHNILQTVTQLSKTFRSTKEKNKDVEVELTDEPPIIKKFESDYIKKNNM